MWCSLLRTRVMARLRSYSFTSAKTPIRRHWSAIISPILGYGRNAWMVAISTLSRSPLSVRTRKPSPSFFASPILSSSAFACAASCVDHLARHSGPGL